MTWRQKENTFKLTLNGVPFDIDEPDGYTELESIIERDREAHGTFFEYTPAEFPLRFTGLGKSLLRAQFDNYGVDAQANLGFVAEEILVPEYEIRPTSQHNAQYNNLFTHNTGVGQTINIANPCTINSVGFYCSSKTNNPVHSFAVAIFTAPLFIGQKAIYYKFDFGDSTQINAGDWIETEINHEITHPGNYAIVLYAYNNGGTINVLNKVSIGYNNTNPYSGGYLLTASGGDTVGATTSLASYDLRCYAEIQETPRVIFNGQIDFSQARENQQYFSCTILRSDLLIKLRNNIDKKVNLLSGQNIYGNYSYPISTYTARLHPFLIRKQYSALQEIEDDYNLELSDQSKAIVLYNFPEKETTEFDERVNDKYEIKTYDINKEYATWLVVDEPGDYTVTFNYHFKYSHRIVNDSAPDDDYVHYVKAKIAFFDPGFYVGGTETDLPLLNDDGGTVKEVTLGSSISSGGPGLDTTVEQTEQGTLTISKTLSGSPKQVEKGNWILVWVELETGNYDSGLSTTYKYQDLGSQISISANTRYEESDAKCLLIGDAIEQNIRMITGKEIPLDSDFFASSGCGYNNVLTNGYQLRGIDKPILASFRDLFHNGVQPIFGLGYSVEESKIKMELWEYFYQETELIDLGIVGDYEEEVLGEDIFNQCTFGYNTYSNDENLASTIEDPHTRGSWNTSIENVKGEFVKVSDFILSSFLIEQTRRLSITALSTVSNRHDDRLFMMAIEKDYEGPDYDFRAELSNIYTTATGMENIDTAYNLRHTVKRMLMNWGVWINSFAFRYESDDSELINLYFLNNASLTTQFDSGEECSLGDTELAEITEGEDVEHLDLQRGEAKFDQVKITFTKQLTQEQLNLIRDAHDGDLQVYQGRYGYITCQDYNGIEQTGWLLRLSTNIYSNLGRFELLKRHIWIAKSINMDMDSPAKTGVHALSATGSTRIAQYFYLPAGKLREIRIHCAQFSQSVSITIYRCDENFWTGLPTAIGNDIVLDSTNYSLYSGLNTITLNKDIENNDLYAIQFRRNGYNAYFDRYLLTDPPQGSLDEIPGTWQKYSSGWLDPDHRFPLRFGYNYDYTTNDTRTFGITGTSWYMSSFNNIADEKGQQVTFLNDGTLIEVQFWFAKTDNPTGTFDCVISTLDGSGFPDTEIDAVQFTPENADVTTITFSTAVTAGDYVIWVRHNGDGSLDASNRWNFRLIAESTPYFYGNYIENNNGGGWTEDTASKVMMKWKYEPSQ